MFKEPKHFPQWVEYTCICEEIKTIEYLECLYANSQNAATSNRNYRVSKRSVNNIKHIDCGEVFNEFKMGTITFECVNFPIKSLIVLINYESC